MRTMNLSEDDLELLLDVLETACEAVASDFELLETANAAPESDEELVLDEGQTEALEWLQRVIELRDKIETQSVLGGPFLDGRRMEMGIGPVQAAELAAVVVAAEMRALWRRAVRGPRRPGWTLRTELAAAAVRAVLDRSKWRGVHWLRAAQEGLPTPSRAAQQVRFAAVDAGGVAAMGCVPRDGTSPRRTIVYYHGGGYVIGSPATHRDLLARLALGARARVLGVDYRLAPEHRFPAAHDDCLTATRWVLAQGTAPEALAVAGDSAGGALAVATLCALRDAGDPLPAAAVLVCPWTEPLAVGGSMEANADSDVVDRELLVGWAGAYAPGEAVRDPRVTVLEAKLDGLPPTWIQAGGAEVLLDQIQAFADRARSAGVDVRLDVAPGMFHDWQLQAELLPEGARAVAAIVDFLDERLA